jgi:hypothetical protein
MTIVKSKKASWDVFNENRRICGKLFIKRGNRVNLKLFGIKKMLKFNFKNYFTWKNSFFAKIPQLYLLFPFHSAIILKLSMNHVIDNCTPYSKLIFCLTGNKHAWYHLLLSLSPHFPPWTARIEIEMYIKWLVCDLKKAIRDYCLPSLFSHHRASTTSQFFSIYIL